MILRALFLPLLLAAGTLPAHTSETFAPSDLDGLADEVESFLNVIAVDGREEPARDWVRQRLQGLPARQDAAGNVILTVGSGSPRRLVACPLGEPGYAVTRIEPDGWLRVFPTGAVAVGPLWDQSHEGNVVMVGGSRGWVPGGVTLQSVHLMQGQGPEPGGRGPFHPGEVWIDVGAESAAEVEEMGIRLLDPVALVRRPARLAGGLLAGPSAALKAACVAQVDAAARLRKPGAGTVVFAWTAGDLLNGSGLHHLVREQGPFEEALVMSWSFGWKEREDASPVPESLPEPGTGVLGAGQVPKAIATQPAPHVPPPADHGGDAPWGSARLGWLGLPARYLGSPVEAVSLEDVQRLSAALLAFAGGTVRPRTPTPVPPPPPLFQMNEEHRETADLLASLIARYGVSGAEGPVRDEVRRHLPAWAKPEVDAKGNLTVTFGQGDEHVLFVAHLDEVGFRVAEVLPDGRLRVETRGGLQRNAWEAHAALVHGDRGSIPAVFEPREGWRAADERELSGALTVSPGQVSAEEVARMGVRAGSTVTMPKRMFRIGRHRALARGFDDRNGCTALLLALRRIDPAKLERRITFAWVVEEEVGLFGSLELAKRLKDLDRVHPVDTFVSSDTPRETRQFAYAPLGRGAVLRAMDNASLVPRELIDRYLEIARRHGIPVQYGMTGGASDGIAFLPNGVEMIPFSWPGRNSHSPVEVSDLRDVEALVRLVVAAATE